MLADLHLCTSCAGIACGPPCVYSHHLWFKVPSAVLLNHVWLIQCICDWRQTSAVVAQKLAAGLKCACWLNFCCEANFCSATAYFCLQRFEQCLFNMSEWNSSSSSAGWPRRSHLLQMWLHLAHPMLLLHTFSHSRPSMAKPDAFDLGRATRQLEIFQTGMLLFMILWQLLYATIDYNCYTLTSTMVLLLSRLRSNCV